MSTRKSRYAKKATKRLSDRRKTAKPVESSSPPQEEKEDTQVSNSREKARVALRGRGKGNPRKGQKKAPPKRVDAKDGKPLPDGRKMKEGLEWLKHGKPQEDTRKRARVTPASDGVSAMLLTITDPKKMVEWAKTVDGMNLKKLAELASQVGKIGNGLVRMRVGNLVRGAINRTAKKLTKEAEQKKQKTT